MKIFLFVLLSIHGLVHLLGFAKAVWHMPDGDIPYAKYIFDEIEYNCTAATPAD